MGVNYDSGVSESGSYFYTNGGWGYSPTFYLMAYVTTIYSYLRVYGWGWVHFVQDVNGYNTAYLNEVYSNLGGGNYAI